MKDQFFADYLERLEGLQRRLHKDVRELPAQAMDWSPGPQMNSVAVLLACSPRSSQVAMLGSSDFCWAATQARLNSEGV